MGLPELGAVVAERYRLEAPLGSGASARVFRAFDATLVRSVAIKFLHAGLERDRDALAQRFLREARLSASVEHPNVMRTLDFGVSEGRPFMVMELLRGQTLAARIASAPQPHLNEAVEIMLGLLAGLGAVHRAGVVHRDLKPDNVYLAEEGGVMRPKLMDFGVSRVARSEPGGVRSALSSQDGMVVGTPEYMAPEQARGLSAIDGRSDVYAAGVVLFELLTMQRPYEAETMADLLVKIAKGGAPSPAVLRPELPQGVCAVVTQAMAHDPSRRFSDPRAMANALCAVMGLAPEVAARGTVEHFVPAPSAPSVAAHSIEDAATVQAPARAAPSTAPAQPAQHGLELTRAALADLSDVIEDNRTHSVPIAALPGLQTQVAHLQGAVGELQLDPAAVVQVRRVSSAQPRPSVGVVVPGERFRGRRARGFPTGWLFASLAVAGLGYFATAGGEGASPLDRLRGLWAGPRAVVGPAEGAQPHGRIRVRLQGVPKTAVVMLDGEKRAETEFDLPADGALHYVEVRQRGMHTWSARFEGRRDHTFMVLMLEQRRERK